MSVASETPQEMNRSLSHSVRSTASNNPPRAESHRSTPRQTATPSPVPPSPVQQASPAGLKVTFPDTTQPQPSPQASVTSSPVQPPPAAASLRGSFRGSPALSAAGTPKPASPYAASQRAPSMGGASPQAQPGVVPRAPSEAAGSPAMMSQPRASPGMPPSVTRSPAVSVGRAPSIQGTPRQASVASLHDTVGSLPRSARGSVVSVPPAMPPTENDRRPSIPGPASQLGEIHDAVQQELEASVGHTFVTNNSMQFANKSFSRSVTGGEAMSLLQAELEDEKRKVTELESRNNSLERLLNSNSGEDKAKLVNMQKEISKKAKRIKDLETAAKRLKSDLRTKECQVVTLNDALEHAEHRPAPRAEEYMYAEGQPAMPPPGPVNAYAHQGLHAPSSGSMAPQQMYEQYPPQVQEYYQPVSHQSTQSLPPAPRAPTVPPAPVLDLPADLFQVDGAGDVDILVKHLLARASLDGPLPALHSQADINNVAQNILYDYCSPKGSPQRWRAH